MSRMIDRLPDAEWLPPGWLRPEAVTRATKIIADGGSEEDLDNLISRAEAEEIIEAHNRWTDPSGFRDPIIRSATGKPVIVADNVVEFCWQHVSTGGADENFGLFDCPNAAPPFPSFWIEARIPAAVQLREVVYAMGCQMDATTPQWVIDNNIRENAIHLEKLAKEHLDEARWILNATVLLERHKGQILPLCMVAVAIGADGRVLGEAELGKGGKEMETEGDRDGVRLVLSFILTAIAFMHCRNVKLEENHPSAKLNKARVKRGKKPLLRFHTLQIESMRRVLTSEGQAANTGIKQALHICRGHFKRFDEKPLFGKHRGLYWWEQQVRGRSSQGVVVKDYAPKANPHAPAPHEQPTTRAWAEAAALTDAEPSRDDEESRA